MICADCPMRKATPLKPLTTRQAAVLTFIAHECRTNGVAPTLDAVRIRFGWRAISTAHEHLETLQAKGYVARIHGAEQGTRLTPAAVEWIDRGAFVTRVGENVRPLPANGDRS
jgi:SOS-response transcriptional repressors (RecA-mediated autopeptidases)